jgi:glycosyltransferase involved in cell wall biosynthesis
MKLCLINPTRQGRTVVYKFAKHLVSEKDHKVVILQPGSQNQFAKRTYFQPFKKGIEIIYSPAFFFPNINYNLPSFNKQIRTLSKLSAEQKCEIIQACDYYYPTSIAPIIVKRKYKIPIILTNNALPGYSWFYGNRFVDAIAKMYTFSIGKKILNSYDRVVFLYSRALEEVEKFGVPKEKTFVIPNGVDVKSFSRSSDIDQLRAKLSLKDNEKVLLFVGRIAKLKRLEILIALTKSLIKEGFRLKTLLVGDGPDREFYEKLARPIRSNVIFIGKVPFTEVAKYYSIADIFVLPSPSEGLPQVLLEASAAGTPCVATNVNGTSDIIMHGKTGYLVERWNIDAYHDYVKVLLENEQSSKKMGSMAVQFVNENFSWDVVIDKYEKLYEDIMNS